MHFVVKKYILVTMTAQEIHCYINASTFLTLTDSKCFYVDKSITIGEIIQAIADE